MNNLLQKFEKEQIKKLTSKKSIPTFRPGDTLKVILKITEGDRSRLQAFEGVCTARKNNLLKSKRLLNSKFTVRKLSHGEGVERVFPLFSPNIDKIEVIRKGDVNRAKLYYLKQRKGKSARIADRDRGDEIDEFAMTEEKSDDIKDVKTNDNEDSLSKETNEKLETNNLEAESKNINKPVEEKAVEEKKSIEKESKSTASEADKTDDESKK